MIKFNSAEATDIQQEIISCLERAARDLVSPAIIPVELSFSDLKSSGQAPGEIGGEKAKLMIKVELSWPA